MIFESKEKT